MSELLLVEMLAGISPAWRALVDPPSLRPVAAGLAPVATMLAPPPPLVFEALRYGEPGDVRVVLMGQDPFPTPGDAQGLSFSVPPGARVPPALGRVFGCLERAGLRPGAGGSGDLRPWAAQGVLLLNAALTTVEGARGAHAKVWSAWVRGFVGRLCAARAGGPPLIFMLWGGNARALAGLVRRHGHAAHEWTHPSPLADNKEPEGARFRDCPHFEAANAALAAAGRRPICWDNAADCVAFADGACLRNGAQDARAGFAAVVVGAQFGTSVVRGPVRPAAYRFVDDAAPWAGIEPSPATPTAPGAGARADAEDRRAGIEAEGAEPRAAVPDAAGDGGAGADAEGAELRAADPVAAGDGGAGAEAADAEGAAGPEDPPEEKDGGRVRPSNNRAELLALVYCFLALIRGRASGRVEVVSDSLISVRTLGEWYPARLAKGTAGAMKNPDLIALAWRLLGVLRQQAASVRLTHVRGHQPEPPPDAASRDKVLRRGNTLADRHASAAVCCAGVEVASHLAVLRALVD